MNELIITTACTHRYGMIGMIERQVLEAGIDFAMRFMAPVDSWERAITIERRLSAVEEMAASALDRYEFMVHVDSRDMIFVGSRASAVAKIPSNGRVLMAADRHCWPEEDLAEQIPGRPSPWRFANCGLIAGRPKALLAWVEAMRRHPGYEEGLIDQAVSNRVLAGPAPFFDVDHDTRLVYCMHRDAGELEWHAGTLRNKLTGTFPEFIHFNGPYCNPAPWLEKIGCQAQRT